MGRRDSDAVTSESIAVGIEGDRHSLCGAVKKFELHGSQYNGFLTLKEQCARRIATIKNEQIKCIILAYLSPNLFKYVTKDIFNLQRDEFVSNCTEPFYLCQECTMDTYEVSRYCQCPNMYSAIKALNKHFFKRMNAESEDENEDENDDENEDEMEEEMEDRPKQFRLSYKIPYDGQDHTRELKRPTSFFLYLSPTQYGEGFSTDWGIFAESHIINSQISAKDKLLFVDAMRFLGAFRSKYKEPKIVLYRRREYVL